MDLSSSLSVTKEFRIVKRGYDPDEVDAFLDQIALGVAELKRKAAEADDQVAAARSTPAAPAAAAEAEEIHRALILAQRAADEEVRKAGEEAERIVAEARERAEALLRDADRDVAHRREEGQAALRDDIARLEGEREALAHDVGVLESHVEEQREVVQAAVGELQSLLDHPEAFRVAPSTGAAGGFPAPGVAPVVPQPRTEAVAAVEDEDGDDDEEGDATPVPALAERASAPDDEVVEPLPGLDDLARALDAEEDEADDAGLTGAAAPVDPGPPTEALDPVVPGEEGEDDAFLAELRKAMLDDEPLGPRDTALLPGPRMEEAPARGARARFGRRR